MSIRWLLCSCVALLMGCASSSARDTAGAPDVLGATVTGTGTADVILVPGLSGSDLPWRATAARLSDRYRVHVIRIPGLGHADAAKVAPQSLGELADDLAAYLQSRARLPAIVVAHSAGGVAALRLAAQHPQLVDRLVVVDALPFMSQNQGAKQVDEAWRERARAEAAAITADTDATFLQRVTTQATGSMADQDAAQAIAAQSAQSDRATYAAMIADLMTTDLRAQITGISVPTTVIFADQVPLGAPEGHMARRYAEQYAGSRAHLVPVGPARHYLMLDQPEQFAKALDAALAASTDK